MGTVYRPLLAELPDNREPIYKATEIIYFVAWFVFLIWFSRQNEPFMLWLDGYFLTLVLPDFLCRKFPHEKKPPKTVASILGANMWLTAICWIVAIGTISLAILAGLGVQPMRTFSVPCRRCPILFCRAYLPSGSLFFGLFSVRSSVLRL